jgi:hypothetical protein|tara:strand:- start:154 stop:414 length:261 start_codon:yes stop_codon:yes gene_type:complete
MSDINKFYTDMMNRTTTSKLDVSPAARVVALFRVAVEYGAVHMGIPTLTYLLSRLLTITLGVMVGDKEATYDDILEDFDQEEEVKH